MQKALLVSLFLFGIVRMSYSQCCAGGAGNPIAGGTTQGVLQNRQLELSTNIQFVNSDQFYTGDSRDTNKYFDKFSSTYQYLRIAYGVSDKFTMAVESGNYFKKEETGLNNDPSKTYESSGFSDLVIFPRYNILDKVSGKGRNEITVGLGYKIPIGSYNDSTERIEPFSGKTYYVTNPQAVQPTSGAQDIIFYALYLRSYPATKFNFFTNAIYIKKGWNPLGEKVGDYASIGIFAGKSFLTYFNLIMQVRGEWMNKMKLNEDILLYAYPNYDPEATGYRKIFVSPQLVFTKGMFTIYTNFEIPIYQYVEKTQVGTKFQATTGLSFRINTRKKVVSNVLEGSYYCPMHPEIVSVSEGKCPKCGMDLEKR